MDVAAAPRARVGLPRRALRAAADERLVAGVRSGSRAAFEALYDRHHRGVLAFCRHMLGSREEAEDAVQHTFAAAYTALMADDREIAVKAWLFTIARNRCLSVLRARREQVGLDDVDPPAPETAGLAAAVQRREDLRDLLADLQRLPDDQRAALVLAELGAHSHEEIALVLDVRAAKVKALVFQARETLVSHRKAREADCGEIREQLATLRGGALRRADLRHHVEHCEGCRSFESEVRRQRAGMAVLLPVAPTLALKHSSLAAAFAAAAGTGAAATGGTAVLASGGAVLGVKSIAAKTLVALAVTGGAGGGGYVAVDELRGDPAAPARSQSVRPPAPRAATPAPTRSAPTPATGALPTAAPTRDAGTRRDAAAGRRRAEDRRPGRGRGPGSRGRDGRRGTPGAGPNGRLGPGGARGDRVARGPAERRRAAQRSPQRSAPAAARPAPSERPARRRAEGGAPVRTPTRRTGGRGGRAPQTVAPVPAAPTTEPEAGAGAPELPARTAPADGTGTGG